MTLIAENHITDTTSVDIRAALVTYVAIRRMGVVTILLTDDKD